MRTKVLLLLIVLLWLVSLPGRVIVFILIGGDGGIIEYPQDISRTYWGTRFFAYHAILEIAVFFGIISRFPFGVRELRATRILGAASVVALLVAAHIATFDYRYGYREKMTIAGQKHLVDWVYGPSILGDRGSGHRLEIELLLPGYRPYYSENPEGYQKLWASKADRPSSHGVFASENNPNFSKETCVFQRNTRQCQFENAGAWYYTRNKVSLLSPPLEELKIKVPELFSSFVVP